MEECFWKQVLQTQVSSNGKIRNRILECGVQLYLFGSARFSNVPNDIDILLVYSDDRRITEVLEIKKLLISFLQELNGLEIHMVLLTIRENEEINFIKKEGAIRISI